MKKAFFAFMAASLLFACSSPVLKWIDTPGEKEAQSGDGRFAGPEDKEIISFSFGIEGERVLPFGSPDHTGKFPISVIVPDIPVENLSPIIDYNGERLAPLSGEAQNFSVPVVYTVYARDGSSREYPVTVYPKGPGAKAIIRFTLNLSQTGVSTLAAEGVIDEAAGLITVSVPGGTGISSLTAEVTHTGAIAMDPRNEPYLDETFSFTGDFSAPTTWTVYARDQTTKTYTLTVLREKSDDKEITTFSLGLEEEVIIGGEPQADGKYPILAVVPATSGSPSTPTDMSNLTPFVSYTGVSISPGPATALDFNRTVTYTVTAENRSTREYVVKTILRDLPVSPRITGFYFMNPLVEGVIDQNAKTIALQVPAGTDLTALRPEIYYDGASVSPPGGQPRDFTGSEGSPVQYTVLSRTGAKSVYQVSVSVSGRPTVDDVPETDTEQVAIGTNTDGPDETYNIIIEFPVYIYNPTLNINYPGSTESITVNHEQVVNNYTVGDSNEYNVVVIMPPDTSSDSPAPPPSGAASIDAFYFTNPAAVGNINLAGGDGSTGSPYPITVSVPCGTDLRNLAAGICYTGKEIAGLPHSNPLKDTRSFTDPVDYTVIAEDGTAKTYRATVTPARSDAKEISAVSFSEISSQETTAIISAGPNADGRYPIEVTIPAGEALTSLTPVITHTGVKIESGSGKGFDPPDTSGPGTVTGSGGVDFSQPVNDPVYYTVTADNGTTKAYAVTVRNRLAAEDEPEITGFYFTEPLAVGTINRETKIITVTVPSGVNRGSLRPAVYFKGLSVKPVSGAAVNFTGPATYTVTGTSGKTASYTVIVNPTPSSAKDITRFQFPGIINTETIIGAVPEGGTYPLSVWLPSGTDLRNLAPGISHTGVSIEPGGGIPRDFSGPQTYTVTAEDGSTKTYTVRVNALSGAAALITSFIFDEVPLSGGSPPVRVVASIDQAARKIRAAVPHNAEINSLKPVLTWIGRSIQNSAAAGSTTANPFTDAVRDFAAGQTYVVTPQSGNPVSYTVEIIQQSLVTVSFTGEVEQTVIAANTIDQTTGIVSVTVNTANVTGPYEWYVNGVKQGLPGTETTFNLPVGDGSFIPGRHEIMVSGRGINDGLHYTGKVYFVVSGGGL
jgi:hypothetical protein